MKQKVRPGESSRESLYTFSQGHKLPSERKAEVPSPGVSTAAHPLQVLARTLKRREFM